MALPCASHKPLLATLAPLMKPMLPLLPVQFTVPALTKLTALKDLAALVWMLSTSDASSGLGAVVPGTKSPLAHVKVAAAAGPAAANKPQAIEATAALRVGVR